MCYALDSESSTTSEEKHKLIINIILGTLAQIGRRQSQSKTIIKVFLFLEVQLGICMHGIILADILKFISVITLFIVDRTIIFNHDSC